MRRDWEVTNEALGRRSLRSAPKPFVTLPNYPTMCCLPIFSAAHTAVLCSLRFFFIPKLLTTFFASFRRRRFAVISLFLDTANKNERISLICFDFLNKYLKSSKNVVFVETLEMLVSDKCRNCSRHVAEIMKYFWQFA